MEGLRLDIPGKDRPEFDILRGVVCEQAACYMKAFSGSNMMYRSYNEKKSSLDLY